MVGLPEGGMSLRPGSPCDNFQVNYPFLCKTEMDRLLNFFENYVIITFDFFFRVIAMFS